MKKKYKIGIIPGDGIGRDAIAAARIVLDAVNGLSGFKMDFEPMGTGELAVENTVIPFPRRPWTEY